MPLITIALLPFLGALLPALLIRAGRNACTWSAVVVTGTALIGLLTHAPVVFSGGVVEEKLEWLPVMGLNANFFLDGLATFTQTMFDTRGRPTQADLNSFCAAGFSDRLALEIVLALAINTLRNSSNHLFHTEVDETFADYKLAPAA